MRRRPWRNSSKTTTPRALRPRVICNGKVVFRAGSGFADKEKNIKAHSGSIYRTASIAKGITGVLGYDLQDAGLIDLDDQTASIVPGLASQHDHTVLQLLQNTGCFGSYSDVPGDENADQTQYASAQDVLTDKQDGVLASNDAIIDGCTPGNGYTYSTHGYTAAAAAYEVATGKTFDVVLKERISDVLGLSTLRAESRLDPDSSGELVKLYKKARGGYAPVTESEFENNSWKWGGGGMQSSPLDLAKLGDALLSNKLFPEALRDEMWSGTTANSSYGAGWDLSSSTNPSQVRKRGRQQAALAHIRMDTNERITVVAMTNGSYTQAEGSIINTLTSELLALAQTHCDPVPAPAPRPVPAPVVDSDRDNLRDSWELQFSRSLKTLDGKSDYDHDGETDAAEQLAGTDPTDPASVFRAWLTSTRGGLQIQWDRANPIANTPCIRAMG